MNKVKCKICEKEYQETGLGYHLTQKHNVKVEDYILEHYNIPKSVVEWRTLTIKDAEYALKLREEYPQFDNYIEMFQHIYDQYKDYRKMNKAFERDIGVFCICLGVKVDLSLSQEHKNKISKKRVGKSLSEEHRKSIGRGLLKQEGKKERYKKLSERMKGHRHSKESIEKMIKNRSNPSIPFRGKAGIRPDLNQYFRSTWEANMARVFNMMLIDYHFEPKTFWLKRSDGSDISYTPDFYLPKFDKYIEVKGYWFDDAREKFDLFKEQYPEIRIDVIDSDKYKAYERRFKHQIEEWE